MAVPGSEELRTLCANTIKMLAVDQVEAAKCGHPGAPMGTADIMLVLWSEFLNFDPDHPEWINRDRFVLSAGHASALLYSLLHLYGYDLAIDDLKKFRQFGSRTPGHPEHGHTPGVEVTTGPLGQGFANGVGLALAERMMQARFPEAPLDHFIYALVSDGDLMEGVSGEAASLAGHLGLGNLIYLYDDNHITIEGSTELAFTEDVARRFEGYHWHVRRVDGHDPAAIRTAIRSARRERQRPSLILCRTTIGKGSPNKANTPEVHGAAMGAEETKLTKQALGWPLEPTFHVPPKAATFFKSVAAEGRKIHTTWERRLKRWKKAHPDQAALWDAYWTRAVPADLADKLAEGMAGVVDATRNLSGKVIQKAAALVPSLVGGSADLAPSTRTDIKGGGDVGVRKAKSDTVDFSGRILHFGVREHAMGSMMTGMSLYGSFIPFGGTFFVFLDYCRPAVRLAAITQARTIYVFTHDSLFVGEDGPTHQPVEHASTLRAIPGMHVWRPADGLETAMAWAYAIKDCPGPSALLLTRQNIEPLPYPAGFDKNTILKGAYAIIDPPGRPDAILIATGSEVGPAMGAAKILAEIGCMIRVVSMPCTQRFDLQPAEYRDELIPRYGLPIAVVEASRDLGWHKYAGREGLILGMECFGVCGPYKKLAEEFGFVAPKIAERIKQWLG